MIVELFSKRMKKQQGKITDIYQYDEIPKKLRVQIVQILNDSIGDDLQSWKFIRDCMRKELGVLELLNEYFSSSKEECLNFLLYCKETEAVIDIIELSFKIVEQIGKRIDPFAQSYGRCQNGTEAIKELNYRFKENAVGYQFIEGIIIRIDNEIIHTDVIKPALQLLYDENFSGANEEFLKAHDYYRKNDYKNSILYAGKAFESTMKTICEKEKYKYNKDKDTANKLIQILCNNDFIPISLKTHFEGLDKAISSIKTTLETGLPTLRNRNGGHGQGNEVVYVPQQFVTYALNLAATNIVLLVDLYKENKK